MTLCFSIGVLGVFEELPTLLVCVRVGAFLGLKCMYCLQELK